MSLVVKRKRTSTSAFMRVKMTCWRAALLPLCACGADDGGGAAPAEAGPLTTVGGHGGVGSPGAAGAMASAGAGGGMNLAGALGESVVSNGGGAGGTVSPAAALAGEGASTSFTEPSLISETGLYRDVANAVLAEDVQEYAPQFELWSDGAVKRRFVSLPPGTTIDTSNMELWRYPIGTRLWKEFSREGVRVETRFIRKITKTKWFMGAFVWNDDLTDAAAAPDGMRDARHTEHDVPSQAQCEECHTNLGDRVLGFSAIQLSHSNAGVTLSQLISESRLSIVPAAEIVVPGTDPQRKALGYLHANCGHCHNPSSEQATLGLDLWLAVDGLASVEATTTYRTTLAQETTTPQLPPNQPALRIVAGDPEQSALLWRMTQPIAPTEEVHMPLLGSEVTDAEGVALVTEFIKSL